MGEQRESRQSSPLFGYLIAVIGLVIAVALGWAMMAIGARRLADAERVREQAEGRLLVAVSFAAREAVTQAQEARVSIIRSNWGDAQRRLSRVNELVTLLEQVAPDADREAVNQVRDRTGEVQRLVGEQSTDALSALDTLITDLDRLRGRKGPL
jgi:type II secretory pathway pseudopilin PulG